MTPRQNESGSTFNVRDHNLSEVIQLLHRNGAMSRASISRETGLSAPTVSALANVLIESGLIGEAGEAESSGGRRPILMQFKYQARYAMGIDLGATHITSTVINLGGTTVAKRTVGVDAMRDPQAAIELARSYLSEMLDETNISASEILGVGIAAPAPLEGQGLSLLSPIILPAWKGIDLKKEIGRDLENLRIYVDNDANAGALAEKWWGAGRGYSNMAYIKLGTGVGSGLIINDDIYRGSAGTAGEIGHTSINSDGPMCRCGNHGCMESYVGSPAIIANVANKIKTQPIPGLAPGNIKVRDLATAAFSGDSTAIQIIQEVGGYLGIAIANLLNLINPGLIVMGGDLVAAGPVMLQAVQETALARAIPKAGKEVTIIASDMGDDVVAIGAATLVFHHAFQPGMIANILIPEKEVARRTSSVAIG
ncbi:MAG TPA: ROK family transcriptional regulator [Anaerolineales bacterium]|jgi:glucokinase-like ROK family protein|nr:ROK family transcriptional regulator [Anaerolineales bacterium]